MPLKGEDVRPATSVRRGSARCDRAEGMGRFGGSQAPGSARWKRRPPLDRQGTSWRTSGRPWLHQGLHVDYVSTWWLAEAHRGDQADRRRALPVTKRTDMTLGQGCGDLTDPGLSPYGEAKPPILKKWAQCAAISGAKGCAAGPKGWLADNTFDDPSPDLRSGLHT